MFHQNSPILSVNTILILVLLESKAGFEIGFFCYYFLLTYDKFLCRFCESPASVVQLYVCATTQIVQIYWTSVS